jgi:integrase
LLQSGLKSARLHPHFVQRQRLRWSDIDLKASELHVRQRADRFNDIGAPKSESSQRKISFPPEVAIAPKEWKLACPKTTSGIAFPSPTGRIEHHKNMLRSLSSIIVSAHVVKLKGDASGEKAKPKAKYGLHAFRHFFASWCINPKTRGGRELPPKVCRS